ncbi:angiopoietin-1 receptor-like [Diadema setosum]|uniref:angiopoietin-1 receptor-like n=1 Tax=Diadema setosum TaxID=31175 RepID=UPI003B3AE73D
MRNSEYWLNSLDTVWLKDGSPLDIGEASGSSLYLPGPINASYAGIYEIHLPGQEDRKGFYRLIVRACQAGKYGPPHCRGVCDKCYNGGICDDISGRCICPNNFRGPNCLEICKRFGGNRFGYNCDKRCTYQSDPSGPCQNYLFCLPDPFGCSCDVGVHGFACDQECESGKFGADCSQTCHCQSGGCNRYSGICDSGSCAEGYTGDNCQIPAFCERGYYGRNCTKKCHCLNDEACNRNSGECPSKCAVGYKNVSIDNFRRCRACPRGSYGHECVKRCHCPKPVCDNVDGCNGQCDENWLGPDCRSGITSVFSTKVNPGQPSQISVYVTVEDDAVGYLSLTMDLPDSTLPSPIDDALPFLEDPPNVRAVNSTTVRLRWNAISGDTPFVALIGYTRERKDDYDNMTWVEHERVALSRGMTSLLVGGLLADTEYDVAVSMVREGPGGTGAPSPSASIRTNCGIAPPPSRLFIIDKNATTIRLTWSIASPSYRNGNVTGYEVRYDLQDSESSEVVSKVVIVRSQDFVTDYSLTDLPSERNLTIMVRIVNGVGKSKWSEPRNTSTFAVGSQTCAA